MSADGPSQRRALFLAVLSNLLGGSAYFAIEQALRVWPPSALVFVRVLLSIPLFMIVTPRGSFSHALPADYGRILLVGSIGFAGPLLVSAHGLVHSDSSHGAILIGIEPVVLVLMARLFLGESMTRSQVVSIGLALTGAIIVVSDGRLGDMFELKGSALGNLMLAATALLWGIYTIAAKPTLARVSAPAFCSSTGVIAAVCVLPFAVPEARALDLERMIEPLSLLALGYLVLGVSFGAVMTWNLALKSIPASRMAVLVLLQPVTGVLLGVVAGEPTTLAKIVGAVFVFLAIWLSTRPPRPNSEVHSRTE
ncbi:MAG: DMT family transporter [Deltaproteobacteria bacterium]|nr:DMT family transporter [Deltaproteobacteria bacterium]